MVYPEGVFYEKCVCPLTPSPAISVIMPVYNAANFLREAIDSILAQTFTNFEFIIVNDCSRDESDRIIRSYTDTRILYKVHEVNKGVVAAMNTALESVRSPYVCIMHADDVSLPERLAWQKDWLDKHPQTALVAGLTEPINEKGEPASSWKMDEKTLSREAIKRVMKWENCLTHSTVMIRTEVLKKYGYDTSQQLPEYAVEDYPLWLNLLSDGYDIEKIPRPVIKYRVHSQNTTHVHYRKINPYYLYFQTKRIYWKVRKQKWGVTAYDRLVYCTMLTDRLKAILKDFFAIFTKTRFMKINKILFFLLGLALSGPLVKGQTVVNSTGQTLVSTDYQIEYSIGEIAITTLPGGNNQVTQGVLQPAVKVADPTCDIINNTLQYFPNPTQDYIRIVGRHDWITSYQIYAADGKLVSNTRYFNNYIDLRKLASGMYIIRLLPGCGGEYKTLKIIKQH